jgi:hypothetical protein
LIPAASQNLEALLVDVGDVPAISSLGSGLPDCAATAAGWPEDRADEQDEERCDGGS